MGDNDIDALLNHFLTGLRETLPLVALWAHGSLALGDFQPGRSDLDIVAVIESGVTDAQRHRLKRLHRALAEEFPAAAKLHCSYVVREQLPDPDVRHLTWAHQELLTRPVTPVSRRELHMGDSVLFGSSPTELLPRASDEELSAFIRADLEGFWLPATSKPTLWLRDIWVDLGLLTVARATVTLDDGRLITKGEALDVLRAMGAPPAVVADIHARRYGSTASRPPHRRLLRAHRARTFTRMTIKRTLASH
ncbi:nucleotidyltransferase domain-containing protein [Streptomyces sp. NPDC054841]